MVRPGFFADLVVLEESPLAVDPASLHALTVSMTLVGGAVVYER